MQKKLDKIIKKPLIQDNNKIKRLKKLYRHKSIIDL